jgi:hypothetical protein
MAASHGRPRRRGARIAGGIGTTLLLLAIGWWLFAIPAVVKYPTDVDARLSYAGTFTVFADPSTFAPLDTPLGTPLTIERHIKADGDASGSSRVVLEETIEQRAGGAVETTQHNAYVMDRNDITNVADGRAYSFDPDNVVDRSGAYRLHFPFGTDPNGDYTIYKNETAATFEATGTGRSFEVEGLTLHEFAVRSKAVPLDAAYLAEMRKSTPLPDTLTLEQLKPHLAKIGIDVDALMTALLPALSPEDSAALVEFAAAPVPLEYTQSFEGSVGVETTTGSEVKVDTVTETLGIRPGAAQVEALLALLDRYPDVRAAVEASDALAAIAAGDPIPVVTYEYAQTDASVADTAATVKDQRAMVLVATRYTPRGLLVVAGAALTVSLILSRRGRPSPQAPESEKQGPPERQPVHAAV